MFSLIFFDISKHARLLATAACFKYCILLSIVHTFYIENDAEILPVYMEGSWERVSDGFYDATCND